MPEGPSIVILKEEAARFTGRKVQEVTGNAKIDLERLPLSADGLDHVEGARDRPGALIELATGGDDYELACTAAPERGEPAQERRTRSGP